jgi:uncharacterized protein (TIGR03437 family)
MRLALLLVPFALPFALSAQLIPAGQPVPLGPNPPVVFLNGYQLDCSSSSFSGTFGSADTVLQASQIITLFFDNCTVPNSPSIETLGVSFGQFLAALKYTDGTPVTQVDVVAHSMGGLIVRSYLAGKQNVSPAAFAPPANPGIRKAIFLATPHFGTGIASNFGFDTQTTELSTGSQFLFDLNTWNDGTDDLRGVDALAVAGDGGTGSESSIKGFDDGVVTLTSASLGFVRPGRTRVIPTCHADVSLLIEFGYCPSNVPFIADITAASNSSAQIIVSFLTGTTAWQSVGAAIESDPVGSTLGGVNIEAQDLNGAEQPISSASIAVPTGTLNLKITSGNIAFSEGLIPNTTLATLVKLLGAVTLSPTIDLPATTVLPVIAKPGPVIYRALPAASTTFPLNVAPGELVTIYGANLATTTQVESAPLPTQSAGVQVLVSGTAVPIEYLSPSQINIVYAGPTSGLTQLTVVNGSGKHTVNVLLALAVPSVFSLDSSGTGPAAALNGITGQVVGASTPLHAGDYVSLYMTGLGQTTLTNGFNYAQIQPTVSVGGENCTVIYAGRTPQYQGMDQINCQIPSGIVASSSVPLTVTSNGRVSNTVTLAIQ